MRGGMSLVNAGLGGMRTAHTEDNSARCILDTLAFMHVFTFKSSPLWVLKAAAPAALCTGSVPPARLM